MQTNQVKNNKKKNNKQKPQTKPTQKAKKPTMTSNVPAPRRAGRRRQNKNQAKQTPLKGKEERVVFKSVEGRDAASTRENIMVVAVCIPKAVEAAFCALASRSFLFEVNSSGSPVYHGYVAFMMDLKNIMSTEIPASCSRLDYLNDILGTYIPKTIPFKTDAELAYSWGNLDSVQTSNLISIRGYNYYFYVDDGGTAGNWITQSPPSIPSSDKVAFDKLAEIYSVLSKKTPGLTFDPSHTDITSKYRKDVSGFAAGADYYGNGNGRNGPAYSCESEVPFRAPLLSGIADYDRTRISRNFRLTAGDTTTAFGLPFVPGFQPKYYNTCYAPIYKFIDIDEFIVLIQKWYIKLVSSYVNTVAKDKIYGGDAIIALTPFGVSPEAFRIYWRQIILSMFPASQSCAQFITYSTGVNDFEPLRVSSNCYPPNTTTAELPSFIIENLRMLQPKIATIKTNFQNDKNALIYVPVFGVYKNIQSYNEFGTFYTGDFNTGVYTPYGSPICAGSESIYPRMIDGMGPSGECLNMNGSLLQGFIEEWNFRVNALKSASATCAIMGGSSNGSLLTLTRYAYYNDQEVVLSQLPEWRRLVKNKHIKERTKEFRRTPSQKTPQIEKELVYVPDNYDLYSQRTQAISSLHPITEEVKLLCNYMVLPSMTIEADGTPPLQRQARVLMLEGNIWDFNRTPGFGVVSRADVLDSFAGICAPGIAASQNDEVQKAIDHMNTTGQGGFVGDALTEIAKIVLPNIPF